jgi:hypothetical protein
MACVKKVDNPAFYTTESKVHEFRGMVGGDTFDWSQRDDCCNVISMCLYIVNNDNVDILLQSLRKYLLSIERSLKNIQVNLPLWVVRLYFGSSVNAAIEKIKKIKRERPELDDKIIAAYEFIISHAQVELYVINEETLTYGIEEIRTARFAPLYDKRVNVCIVREADGTVTNLDCHNIDFFLHSSRHLFYLPNYGKINCFKTYVNDFGVDEHPYLFSGYSGWLVFYKSVLRRDFFASHQNVYDLLAGLFGTKLKLKRDFYNETFETLKKQISELEPPTLSQSKAVLLPHIYSKIVIPHRGTFYLSYVDFISQFKNFDFTNMLNLGFDEILLLDLFKDIISVPLLADSLVEDSLLDRKIPVSQIPITPDSATHHKLQQIKGLVIGDDILTIDFGKYGRPTTSVGTVVTNLLNDTIDIPTVNKHKHIEKTSQFPFDIFNLLYFIDGLLRNINRDKPAFDIQVNYTLSDRNDVYKSSILLNTPYDPKYDRFYDFTEISSGGKRCKKYKSYKFKIKVSRKKRRLQTKKRKNRYKNTPNKR